MSGAPLCLPQGQAESGGIMLAAICWAACAQRRCLPDRALLIEPQSPVESPPPPPPPLPPPSPPSPPPPRRLSLAVLIPPPGTREAPPAMDAASDQFRPYLLTNGAAVTTPARRHYVPHFAVLVESCTLEPLVRLLSPALQELHKSAEKGVRDVESSARDSATTTRKSVHQSLDGHGACWMQDDALPARLCSTVAVIHWS